MPIRWDGRDTVVTEQLGPGVHGGPSGTVLHTLPLRTVIGSDFGISILCIVPPPSCQRLPTTVSIFLPLSKQTLTSPFQFISLVAAASVDENPHPKISCGLGDRSRFTVMGTWTGLLSSGISTVVRFSSMVSVMTSDEIIGPGLRIRVYCLQEVR